MKPCKHVLADGFLAMMEVIQSPSKSLYSFSWTSMGSGQDRSLQDGSPHQIGASKKGVLKTTRLGYVTENLYQNSQQKYQSSETKDVASIVLSS